MVARELFDKIKASKAGTAAGAVARFVADGGVVVPAAVYDARMELCKACTHYRPGVTPVCGVCGCFLKVKTRFPAEQCPLETPMWRAVSDVPADNCGGCGSKLVDKAKP